MGGEQRPDAQTRTSQRCAVESRQMKLPRTKVLFVSFVLALIVSIPAVVSAQGSPPHAFAGFAYIDNGVAPQGTIVHAVIDDIIVGQSSVNAIGRYSVHLFPPASGASFAGKTVTFGVRGLEASETGTWVGPGHVTILDLHASTSQSTNTPTPTPIAMADRAALVALYNATGGSNWNSNNNWLSDVPISQWSGVTTDDNGRVTELDLSQNQLTGPIPPALGNLSNLQGLSLWGNQLTGPIPAELGNLSNLQGLSLSGNQLTGPIPPALGNLSNLQDLSLWRNQLTGPVPPALGNLSNLQELYLSGNQLTGPIPSALSSLTSLEVLSLNQNQLTGPVPAELGNLSNLQWLYLSGNQLTGPIPPELGNLSNLQWLSLSGNQLTGEIPAELGRLTNLTVLYLSGNQLTGCVPGSLRDVAHNDFAELELPFCASGDGDPLIARYDANGDGAIDISELFSAIDDYFAGRADISQLFGVIDLYFSGPTPTPRPTSTPQPTSPASPFVSLSAGGATPAG